LHKSGERQSSPFPGQTYPATSVMGVPSAVKPFRTAIIGNIFGIAAYAAAAGDPLELATIGVYQLPKGTAAVLTVGARVAWDNTAKNINVPGTGRFPVGIATEAAGNGITSVAVRLDGVATVAG